MVRYPKPALLESLGTSHCAIEASAGTGKTYTLEHLIVQLILEEVPLENILVVTFTRKAALELSARVRAKLTELVELPEGAGAAPGPGWDLDEAGLERIRKAQMGFDRACISTIHGFCRQVLDDSAFEGGHLFQQESVASDEVFDRAFTTLLRTAFARDRRDLLEVALVNLRGRDSALTALRKLLREALDEADHLDLPPFQDARSFLQAFPEELAQAFLDDRDGFRAAFPEGQGAVAALLARILERRREALASDRPESFWADADWILDDKKGLAPLRGPALAGAAARLGEAVAGLANFRAILVAAFLPLLRAELRRHKAEAGLYDFDDMISLVDEAMAGPQGPVLVGRLRDRFQVGLIDEFQDTDRRQWSIFKRIFLDSGQGHRLFVVGDPKQAIYGFRGGDLPTYVEALGGIHARTGSAPLQLDRNFRSTAALIRACNDLFAATEGEVFFSPDNAAHYHQDVTCGKPGLRLTGPGGEDLPAIRVVDVAVDGSARNVNFRAAAALARALEETLREGRFTDPDRPSPALRPEDVFVLVSKAREGRIMAQALKARGIPCAVYRQDGLFDGPEAEACRDLLLAIESPFDEARRARALLGPFFGLSLAEAERARDLPEGHPILGRLFSWKDLALKGRFGELFSRVVADSGLSQRLLFLDARQRTLTNLLHILELLQQEALSGHCTLADLAIQVQRWIDDVDRPATEDAETQRLERKDGAVQILTMHKAKGLQAPVVVLFGGTTSGSGNSQLHRSHLGPGGARRAWIGPAAAAPPGVQALILKEEAEEGERLAYVAVTRAEAQLVLPRYLPGSGKSGANFEAGGNPRAGSYLAVNRRLQVLLGSQDAPREHAGIERIPEAAEPGGTAGPAAAPWVPVLPAPLPQPAFEDLRRRGRPVWLFNYTSLQKGRERARAEQGSFEEVKEYAPQGGPGGGRKFGTQVHALLERVDPASFAGLDFEAWLALPGTAALAEGLPRELRREALRWVYNAMALPLALPGGGTAVLARAEELLRELDFLTPYPGRGDFLNGSIDVLFKSGGRAYVLDWKTNRLEGYGPAALDAAVREHYLLQVMIYAVTACRFLGIGDAGHYQRAFGGVVYVFLRGLPEGGVWTLRPTWEELRDWEARLDALRPEQWIPLHAGGERDA